MALWFRGRRKVRVRPLMSAGEGAGGLDSSRGGGAEDLDSLESWGRRGPGYEGGEGGWRSAWLAHLLGKEPRPWLPPSILSDVGGGLGARTPGPVKSKTMAGKPMTARKSWGRGAGHQRPRSSVGSPEPPDLSLTPRPPGPPLPAPSRHWARRPLRGGMLPPRPPLRRSSRPLPPPPEAGSAQTMAWNAPLSGPAGSPSRAPQKKTKNEAAATVPSSSEGRAPGDAFAADRWGRGGSVRPRPAPPLADLP